MGFWKNLLKKKSSDYSRLSRTYTNSRTTKNATTNIVCNNWLQIRQEIKSGKSLHEIYDENPDFHEMMVYSEFKNDCYNEYLKEKNSE